MDQPVYSPLSPPLPTAQRPVLDWGRLYGSARALAISRAATAYPGVSVVVTPGGQAAEILWRALGSFGVEGPLMRFPDWETLPYDLFSPHPDIVSSRLATLRDLPGLERGLVVVSVPALTQRLAPPAWLAAHSVDLSLGDTLDLDALRRGLDDAGYRVVHQVMDPGEFAVRGGLVDLYPMGAEAPFRVELLDEQVESIRSFDPESQRSIERHEALQLLPGREFPMDAAAIRRFRTAFRGRFDVDPRQSPVYRDVSEGLSPGGLEYYLPLFLEHTASFSDYLPERALLMVDDGAAAALEEFQELVRDRFEQRRHDQERPLLRPEDVFLNGAELDAGLSNYFRINIQTFESTEKHAANFATSAPPEVPLQPRAAAPAERLKAFLEKFTGRVLFVAESRGRQEDLRNTLRDQGIGTRRVDNWAAFAGGDASPAITVTDLDQGLLCEDPALAVVTEAQLLGERVRVRQRARGQRDAHAIVRNLADLHIGAPVVHEDHGVGRYRGLTHLQVGDIQQEFMTLEYADGDRLYVPVSSLGLISRYSGAAPDKAPLHRLGGDQWEKIRRRAAARARDVAAELLDVHARRLARKGHAFPVDETLYRAFCADFPFEETPDQEAAIDSVVRDLVSESPMDRVVCGDVGFGKTEVAMRAAFLAVQGGKQVALLVPTTLLGQQHFRNFQDRFSDWPVRVEVLSRFVRPARARDILRNLADGKVDIVIGTHRLLQRDVSFADLGLLIIDEEHRFGVRHKERIKAFRAQVDILTLTATPIPRTLNMALSGLRDLSIIATPPPQRLAVKTFVTEWNDTLLREAFQRELRRGGQVYFLHNEVESIEQAARKVGRLAPGARVEIAHGQLPERELERVMADFYRQRFNVLVCSTIIESGLDVPTANTMIINRADRLGLAQLHQLRGRVGRSHHRAYAYLVVPPRRTMTADALKRLEAIESLEDLGAGFTLATHDLEIRGAGELLGEDQSGNIAEVGFSLYADLLERSLRALRAGEVPDPDRPLHHGTEVDLHVAALIPEDYLPDVHERLILYKRIASAASDETLRELQVEMIDRFGLLPDGTRALFETARLRLRAQRLGIVRLEMGDRGGRLVFGPEAAVDPARVVALVQEQPRVYGLDGQDKLRVRQDLPDLPSRLRAAGELLEYLAA